jgi:hypothetical protein
MALLGGAGRVRPLVRGYDAELLHHPEVVALVPVLGDLAPEKRLMVMPETSKRLPVGGIPIKSPVWVPVDGGTGADELNARDADDRDTLNGGVSYDKCKGDPRDTYISCELRR